MNQDGSVQLHIAETEIGQGADTVFAQLVADTVGIPFEKVHVVSTQDTDTTPFGTSAYASRQTYVAGFVNADLTHANIQSNGFNLYYDSSVAENAYLEGQSFVLPGGGFLAPII